MWGSVFAVALIISAGAAVLLGLLLGEAWADGAVGRAPEVVYLARPAHGRRRAEISTAKVR